MKKIALVSYYVCIAFLLISVGLLEVQVSRIKDMINTSSMPSNAFNKLLSYSDQLEKCTGKYQIPYYWQGQKRVEWEKCGNILHRSEMKQEYNNGYICKRCEPFRKEELKEKEDSLK